MNISERLRLLRTKLNLSQSAAAIKFNIPLGSWKQYEKGPSEPGSGALRNLANGGVNIHWLLNGSGEMLLNTAHVASESTNDSYSIENDHEFPSGFEKFALIPFCDEKDFLEAGSFVDQEPQISQIAFRKDWLKQKGLQVSKCALIKAKGDSMEPTIHDGDLLLVDRSIDAIKDDAIYIVQTDHHLIVKRIQQSLDGSLTIISDNKRYKEKEIGPEQAKDIKIAGRVRWYGHEI